MELLGNWAEQANVSAVDRRDSSWRMAQMESRRSLVGT